MRVDRERFLAALLALGPLAPTGCNAPGGTQVSAEAEKGGKPGVAAGAQAAQGQEGASRGRVVAPAREGLPVPTREGLAPPAREGLPPPSREGLAPPTRETPAAAHPTTTAPATTTTPPATTTKAAATGTSKVPPPPVGRPTPH